MVLTSDLGAILEDKPQFLRGLNEIVGISEKNIFIAGGRDFPGKVAVMLPTYNEYENLAIIIPTILIIFDHYDIDGRVVVVDDDSPDGSWKLVKDFSRVDPRIHLIHRTKNKGRGSAGIVGLRACLNLGADYVIEMDADFSHDPRYIPVLLDQVLRDGYDLVLGSRFVEGGEDHERSLGRKVTSKVSIAIIKTLFPSNVCDCNCGFRCYPRATLERVLKEITTTDYHEFLLRAIEHGCKIKEIPVKFKDRKVGVSKLNPRRLFNSLVELVVIKFPFLRFLRRLVR